MSIDDHYSGTTPVDPTELNPGDVIRTSVQGDQLVVAVEIGAPNRYTGDPLVRVFTDWTQRHNWPPHEYGHVESRRTRVVSRADTAR